MSHTRELSRQLFPPRGTYDPLRSFRGQVGIRWEKKQRRRAVRRWNQRETIREYAWFVEEQIDQEQEDLARLSEYEREYWEHNWYDDDQDDDRYNDDDDYHYTEEESDYLDWYERWIGNRDKEQRLSDQRACQCLPCQDLRRGLYFNSAWEYEAMRRIP